MTSTDRDDSPWLLLIYDVPDRLGGLLARHRFRPHRHGRAWYRVFNPRIPTASSEAAAARREFLQAGLRGRWKRLSRGQDQVCRVIATARNRLERDADKRQAETDSQARQQAERDSYHRARAVLARSRGESVP